MYFNPLALFWIFSVTICFNTGYGLYLWDRDSSARKQQAFIIRTALIGTLLMLGTYAHNLSDEPFKLRSCLYLALVVVHGWTAEMIVDGFIKLRGAIGPIIKDTIHKLASSTQPDSPGEPRVKLQLKTDPLADTETDSEETANVTRQR